MATSIRWSQVVRVVLIVVLASLLYNIFNSSGTSHTSKGRNFRRPKFTRNPTQDSAMANEYLKAIASRRTIYALAKESTISVSRIQEILTETIKHSPSSYNNQAQRIVLLLGTDHEKLWEIADETAKKNLPEEVYGYLGPKLAGFRASYGTILFFDDAATMKPYKEKHPGMPFDQWNTHSQGMLQIHTWDALELEGLGANVQHFDFLPGFAQVVKDNWKLSEDWNLHAQMVFGKPTGGPGPKSFDDIDGKRLLIFGDKR
ncbi:hypothetical protein LTS08_004697 [Lithohypha guttulata]|nr:hypothetical protein LTS08_004697 [Lithohypha guttulata]